MDLTCKFVKDSLKLTGAFYEMDKKQKNVPPTEINRMPYVLKRIKTQLS